MRDQAASRQDSLDALKGFVTVAMASLHLSHWFREGFTFDLFKWFDPFVFSTFLFCFGVGNGLSSHPKKIKPLFQILFLIFLGSLINTLCTDSQNLFPTLRNLITLRNQVPFADFLHPFAFAYLLVWLLERSKFPALPKAWFGLGISIFLFGLGLILKVHLPAGTALSALWAGSFASFQNSPIFFFGLAFAVWRKTGYAGVLTPKKPFYSIGAALGLLSLFVALPYFSRFDFPWKISGSADYVLIGIFVGLLALTATQALLPRLGNRVYSGLVGMGKHTLRSLTIQVLTLPPLGFFLSQNTASSPLRGALALAYLVALIICTR